MNYYKARKKEQLENFRFYLISVAKIKESTVDNYCRRITNICKDEQIDYNFLCKNIDRFVYDYTDGEKKDLGERGHNSYSGALKHLYNYLHHSEDFAVDPDGIIELEKIDEGICQISIKYKDKLLGKIPVFVGDYGKDHRTYYITEKIVQLCLPTIYKNNPEKIFDFLEYAGFRLDFKD